MDYYIKVDHSELKSASSAIDKYVDLMKKRMNSAQGEVASLFAEWQGSDSFQFRSEFDKVDDADSVHMRMLKALESYAQYLKYASNRYKAAQVNAISRANNISKF